VLPLLFVKTYASVGFGFATRKINMKKRREKNVNENFPLEA
jgi:hypothetical protein